MTIFGQHTIAELKDLLLAKDYSVKQVGAAFDKVKQSWRSENPEAYGEWFGDWAAFGVRYDSARQRVIAALEKAKETPVRDDLLPAEDEYNALLKALSQDSAKGVQRGDLQDLYNRLSAVVSIDTSRTPQPGKNDADLDFYAKPGQVLDEMSKQANALGNRLFWVYSAEAVVLLVLGAAYVAYQTRTTHIKLDT